MASLRIHLLQTKESTQKHIQCRVGLLCTAFISILVLINSFTILFVYKQSFMEWITHPSIFPFLLTALPFLLSSAFLNRAFRIVQTVLFFFFAAIASIYLPSGYLNAPLFFIFGLALLIQYDFIVTHFSWKLSLLVIVYSLGIGSLRAILGKFNLTALVLDLLISLAASFLYYSIFAEQIAHQSRENQKLRTQIAQDQVFVQYGRNVNGVVHNMKSILMSVYGFTDLIEQDPSNTEYIQLHRKSLENLENMANSLMFAVRSCQNTSLSKIRLHDLLKSIIELYKANLFYKKKMIIDIDGVDEQHSIHAVPLELMQVFQNLITNSLEAVTEDKTCSIRISSRETVSGRLEILFSDTGPGINWIPQNRELNCLKKNVFLNGKTTKEKGDGLGMIYVQKTLSSVGGALFVKSNPVGCQFRLLLPL